MVAIFEEKDDLVIDSGFSHHMTCDKIKFISMKKYDGGVVRFGDDKASIIHCKGSISLDGKHSTDGVFYVEDIKKNILSVG